MPRPDRFIGITPQFANICGYFVKTGVLLADKTVVVVCSADILLGLK
jgi:hypothetical protein